MFAANALNLTVHDNTCGLVKSSMGGGGANRRFHYVMIIITIKGAQRMKYTMQYTLFSFNISSTLDRVLWNLLNSLDQKKAAKS